MDKYEPTVLVANQVYPIIDEYTARAAMRGMRASIAAIGHWPPDQIERMKDNARDQWRRRIYELGLEGLPDDPFADEPEEEKTMSLDAGVIYTTNVEKEKTMSKTREERIRDLAAELRAIPLNAYRGNEARIAERLLDAAEREEPEWPTKESFTAALGVFSNFDEPVTPLALQSALAAAMHVDPIVQEAVAVVKRTERGTGIVFSLEDLKKAVKEAGLLT